MPPVKAASNTGAGRGILLVDNQDDSRAVTRWFLSSFGYAVDVARSGEDALALFDEMVHDLIITGDSLPGISGSEMAMVLKRRSPSTPVLMYGSSRLKDEHCLDAILPSSSHLLKIKETVEELLASLARKS